MIKKYSLPFSGTFYANPIKKGSVKIIYMKISPSPLPKGEYFETFKKIWHKSIPSAVECLDLSIDACLVFFNFPSEEWISLRTTNIIERLNKEFRRRTKTMEILAVEMACYRILAYISLKIELHWRSNPVGKVCNNLPFFKELAYDKFTQKY